MRRALLGFAAACLLLAGCGSVVPSDSGPDPDPTQPPPAAAPTPTATVSHRSSSGASPWPGAFVLRYGDTQLELGPHTYCYQGDDTGGCVDGFDQDPPSIGSPEEVWVFVPVPGFDELTVNQSLGEGACTSTIPAQAEDFGGGWWLVHPSGAAREYRVSLFAAGSGSGDMIAEVIWNTPSEEEMPDPSASIAVLATHDGRPDSYGVELIIDGLALSPKQASATITVAAANGRSVSFDLTERSIGCGPIGSVSWNGPAEQGKKAAGLGGFPFTIVADLVLDGVTHRATATYPDDQLSETDLRVPLQFNPPLA